MDKTALVEIDIDGGERLINALEESGLHIQVAMWLYFPEPEEWRLVFATPMVDRKGPLKVYTFIQSILNNIVPALDIPLRYITVMSSKDKLTKALHKNFQGMKNSHLRKSFLDGIYIEEAFIYKVS